MWALLADVSAQAEGSMSITQVGLLIGAVVTTLLGSNWMSYRFGQNKPVVRAEVSQPMEVTQTEPFATRRELKELESKHDAFEVRILDMLRDGETRTHRRIDELGSKLDKAIGLQEANNKLNEKILEILLIPKHHEHVSK